MMSVVCFITAVFGKYTKECQPFVSQTIPSDFICFTDNSYLQSNGWALDTHDYHNNYVHSKNPKIISKFYKQSWYHIPVLSKYAVVIWLNANIEIISRKVSEYTIQKLRKYPILAWHNNLSYGLISNDIKISKKLEKYASSSNIIQQYQDFIDDGFKDTYFKELYAYSEHTGVWFTSFIGFINNNVLIKQFMELWFANTLKYECNYDRLSFAYVCYKKGIIPYTLPDNKVYGIPHFTTEFYIRHIE